MLKNRLPELNANVPRLVRFHNTFMSAGSTSSSESTPLKPAEAVATAT